jgi:hypothetical protein
MEIDDEKWREFAALLTQAQAARGGPDADELTADELSVVRDFETGGILI